MPPSGSEHSLDAQSLHCFCSVVAQIPISRVVRVESGRKKRAATRDFQQCGILTSKDSDEPVQPCLSLETPNDVDLVCFRSVLCLLCLCARLLICALWSPAGKGLTSWLSFVVSTVSLSLSHWYPGSGVVLDCIDS